MFEFTKGITVDTPTGNREFVAGDRIKGDEVLPGCLESLRALRVVIPVEAKQLAPEPKKPEPPKPAKKK
jgi:hypothetical protein